MDEYIKTLPVNNPQTPEQKAEQEHQQKKAKEKRQKLLNQLPGNFQMTRNLERHLKEIAIHYVKTGRLKVEDHIAEVRLAMCRACPDDKMVIDDNGVMRCALGSCGCYLDNPNERKLLAGKAHYEALHCDNNHW